MEGSSSSNQMAAPFIVKTYKMVSDAGTDPLIRWGGRNNSFIVVEPALFSQILLPSYFKHNNFSSFIRQLNTYGFRKVDPDRWEFAHESFLRGQTHLLPLIVRRITKRDDREDEDDVMLVQEVEQLREAQQTLDEELQGMTKRLQATERKPQQMMSFLSRVAEEPDFLLDIISSRKKQLAENKKGRLLVPESAQTQQNQYVSDVNNDYSVAVVPGTPIDLERNQQMFSTEIGAGESSLPGADVGFPFSILGEGFF